MMNEMIKKKKIYIIVAIVVGLICLIVFRIYQHKAGDKRMRPDMMKPLVETLTLKPTDLEKEIILMGDTVPKAETKITAKYSGIVKSIPVDYGTTVKKGQVLLLQDTKDIDSSIAQARDTRNQLSSEVTTTDATFDVEYKNALAEFKYIEIDYQRYQKLYQEGAISGNEFDAQEKKYINAKNSLEAVRKQLSQNGASSKVLAKRAELSKAGHNVESLEMQRGDMMIKAPNNGVINSKSVEVGEYLSPGAELFTLVDLSEIYVEYTASEMDIAHLVEGTEVDVRIESLDKNYPAKITFIGQAAESGKKSFLVRAKLLNHDKNLRAGIIAETRMKSVLAKNCLIVPKEAVLEENGEYYVFVLLNDKVSKRKVTIGLANDTHYQIKTGLKTNDIIATTNLNRLDDGVEIMKK